MIKVTFADGTCELRPENSPVLMDSNAPTWVPADVRAMEDARSLDRPGYWLDVARSRSGRMHRLKSWRGYDDAIVWRITGQDPATKALTGAWRSCRVETVGEQIARLEAERDAAQARIDTVVEMVTAALTERTAKGMTVAPSDLASCSTSALKILQRVLR